MNTGWLREFVVLADTCSYSEAAGRLFMGQSSLSKHIKALEQELGVELFERTSRRVKLSAEGEQLRDEAFASLEEESLIHELALAACEPRGLCAEGGVHLPRGGEHQGADKGRPWPCDTDAGPGGPGGRAGDKAHPSQCSDEDKPVLQAGRRPVARSARLPRVRSGGRAMTVPR